jgi:hypothetical protein
MWAPVWAPRAGWTGSTRTTGAAEAPTPAPPPASAPANAGATMVEARESGATVREEAAEEECE